MSDRGPLPGSPAEMSQHVLAIARALYNGLESPNESDSNLEPANIVDGLFFIGRQIRNLGNADAATPMGAIEAHGAALVKASNTVASAISELANAVERSGELLASAMENRP